LNVGYLEPYGATSSATPFLDSLARTGHAWTRMVASGVPTINALMAIHLSIPQHPTRQMASEFTTLRNEAFTVPFARRGYVTRFFSAADPAWDNQTPWLRQWYGGIRYDRARENDALMFADLAAWMRDSLSGEAGGRPFFLTAMTKTNHYPFNPVEGVRPVSDGAPLVTRMDATMAYTDSSLRLFFTEARKQPWFDRTVFVLVADHGFPLSEHGSSQIGYGLYTENIWLPFVMVGKHPALGSPRLRDDLAAQVDIGPTLLDLAGIREPNAHVGHSLLAPLPPDRQTRYALFYEQAFIERGRYRWHGGWGDAPREQGEELFDLVHDRLERRNLLKDKAQVDAGLRVLRDSLSNLARALGRLHVEVLERDALWPPPDTATAP
jgi:phosphoglycerol transferase MdoB-like AlkP superfamily enzyme